MNNFSFHTSIPIEQVVFDSSVYPREKWNTSTIERYADAIEAGAVFPPIVLEAETNRLLDGKHRLEAHKKAGRAEIAAEWRTAPDGMTVSYFAASLSSAHGDRLSNGDIKRLAETEFEANPKLDPEAWGSGLGVPQRTVYRWVSHILERGRTSRANAAWHLTKLGWSQEEIATLLGVTQGQVSLDIKNCHLAKINSALGEFWNEKGLLEAAKRLDLPLVDCYAAVA